MPSSLDILLETLRSKNEYKRKSAVQELGKLAPSNSIIIEALVAARDSDSHEEVRKAAMQALLSPAHQAFIQQNPDWTAQAEAERQTAAILPGPNLKQLQQLLKSKSQWEQVQAVSTIRHFRYVESIPDLIGAAASFSMLMALRGRIDDRKRHKTLLLPILETLNDLGNAAGNQEAKLQNYVQSALPSLVTDIRASDEQKDIDVEEIRQNIGLIKVSAALGQRFGAKKLLGDTRSTALTAAFSPNVAESGFGSHLRYAIAADEILADETQAAVALPLLFRSLKLDEERWTKKSSLGLAAGLLLGGFGTLLTTLIVTFSDGLRREAAMRERADVGSLLLLSPETVTPKTFGALSEPVRYLTAAHAYGTGLTKLAARYPQLLRNEINNNHPPGERVVLAFALALNGEATMAPTLKRFTNSISPEDWVIKILAYEGLIALANRPETSGSVSLADQLSALEDHDGRVSSSIAYVMLGTQNRSYWPFVAKLADANETALRGIASSALFGLAQQGDHSARTKLNALAELEPDKEIREGAKKLLSQLPAE